MSWLKISVIKTEAHIKVTEPECQDNALVDCHTKAAATKSVKTVAHVDEVYSASAEMTPQCQTLAILMPLYHGNSLLLNQRN